MTDFSTWHRQNLDSFAHEASELVKRQRADLATLNARVLQLEASMQRMLADLRDFRCIGASQYALGANATAEFLAVNLEHIMQEAGVSPAPLPVSSSMG